MMVSPFTQPPLSAVPRWTQTSLVAWAVPALSRQITNGSPSNLTDSGLVPTSPEYATGWSVECTFTSVVIPFATHRLTEG